MDISIVVPTFNRCESLVNNIKFIRAQLFPNDRFEIIVVDNGSVDNTREMINELNTHGGKFIRYVFEPRLGLHTARHAGAAAAKGKILAFTDDDVMPHEEWLANLYAHYDNPLVACVGGKVLAKWMIEPPDWIGPFAPGNLSLLDLGNNTLDLDNPTIYGCNFSIRKSVLYEVGGFNPEAFGEIWLGDGETGLLRKVKSAGYRIIYTPDAVVWHIIPPERMTLLYLKHRRANQAAADGFADYRKNLATKYGLIKAMLGFLLFATIRKVCATKALVLRSDSFYRHELESIYSWARAVYNFRLIYSDGFRRIVLKHDWIDRDK